MSVMQRKLFANKEARTKLRDMGGIMSSFPELSGEVQRFNNGMMVEAPRPPTGPTLMDRLQSESLLRETPRLGLDQATRRLLDAGMAPEELQQYVDQGIDLNYLLAQLPPETPPMRSPAEEEVKRINRSRIAGTTTGTPIYEQAVELLPPTPTEEEPAPAEEEAGMTTGTPIYEQRIAELIPSPDETPDGTSDETGGRETGTTGLRARAEERIKLFQDLFGSDEPTARDRAMQFAMIGLAIAAGQSPNALTNIASGLLAGTQAMTAQEAERRKERRALRSSAVTSVLKELEAERKAAAEAAKRSGEDYQPTESYADAVLKMTDTLIKEGEDPVAADRLARQLVDPLYGRGTPVDTGTVERGRQLVQQLRDSGRTDTEIARLVREAGLDPADLGVTDGQ